ncbi:MAG: hypothetical protein IJI88_01170, partial [Atopobiaceae bacterium]|nr:hypothetical protein [Atopobiaceae bacterium]
RDGRPERPAPEQAAWSAHQGAQPAPFQQPQPAPARTGGAGTVLGVLAALGGLFLVAQVVLGAFAVGAMGVGLASCARSCSDDPVRDSPQAVAFIANPAANDRDLATFDALRGSIDSLYQGLAASHDRDPEYHEEPLPVDELRAAIAAGSWPQDPPGYGGVEGSLDPQTWVRIAELSQTWLEGETGERWAVVGFAYPYPDSGPIPVPATRDAGDSTHTTLVCTSGQDEGLYVGVDYYRWSDPTSFGSDLEEARASRAEYEETSGRLAGSDLLGGRRFLLDGSSLYVWEGDEADSLRDPGAFLDFANEVIDTHPVSIVCLLNAGAPVMLGFNAYSYDYPDERPRRLVTLDEAQAELAGARYALSFEYAPSDRLLSVSSWSGEPATLDDLSGVLAPGDTTYDYGLNSFRAPDAGAALDEGLAAEVAAIVGCDAGEVIAATCLEPAESENDDDETNAWVVLPRGVVPEDPEGFCACAASILDAAWARLDIDEGRRTSLHVRIYVVEPEGIVDASGAGVSYPELCQAAREDLSVLEGCQMEVALGIMPSAYLWPGDTESDVWGCEPDDVDGTVSRSREWQFGEELG